MDRRDRIIQILTAVAIAVVTGLLARWGIVIPPPVIPPIDIPPIVIPPGSLPPGSPSPDKPPDPPNAIVRLSLRGVGCSATVIGPRRQDGKWWILTASHCIERIGQTGTIRFLDGRVVGATVVGFDRTADCAWMVSDSNADVYPYARLAGSSPAVGTRVWHAGFGVDRPGNKETGELVASPDNRGQLQFRLSVSSGDSGGGIVWNELGEVISCVCCTARQGGENRTWGSSPEAAERAKPTTMVLDDWIPLEIPQWMPPKPE